MSIISRPLLLWPNFTLSALSFPLQPTKTGLFTNLVSRMLSVMERLRKKYISYRHLDSYHRGRKGKYVDWRRLYMDWSSPLTKKGAWFEKLSSAVQEFGFQRSHAMQIILYLSGRERRELKRRDHRMVLLLESLGLIARQRDSWRDVLYYIYFLIAPSYLWFQLPSDWMKGMTSRW